MSRVNNAHVRVVMPTIFSFLNTHINYASSATQPQYIAIQDGVASDKLKNSFRRSSFCNRFPKAYIIPETHKLQQVCCRLVTLQSSSRYQDAFASLALA